MQISMRTYGLYINGQYIGADSHTLSRSPWLSSESPPLAQCAFVDREEELIEAALAGADETFAQLRRGFFPLPERLEFLKRFHQRLTENAEALVHNLCFEVGKPLGLARAEVKRALLTVEWTLLEAPRFFAGERLPTESHGDWQALEGWVRREGRGPLLAITPFNFPINLALHKIAPAIIAGVPLIQKPSPKAALNALALGDFLHASGLPAGMLSVVQCRDELTHKMCRDPRIRQISFTGSAQVGPRIAADSPDKPCTLELGGSAPVYVDESADLEVASKKIVESAFGYAGQSCISAQNIFAHPAISVALAARLREECAQFRWGDPREDKVLAGPVIDAAAAQRLAKLRARLVSDGASILAEAPELGLVEGIVEISPRISAQVSKNNFVRPTIFGSLDPRNPVTQEEYFGPFANFFSGVDIATFVEIANLYPARLQAAIFSSQHAVALKAAKDLRYGGVMINEAPNFRMDPMPYGGQGLAGTGREGPKQVLDFLCEPKVILMR